ncbi:DUF72 domain-containing protein [Umezawaea sp.]|uniref:DUF72 domain-containing protein n=1 Tax=Umezawaea sp. TaxID=1955258 RepID=UPI002ED673CD
MGDIRIGTSGWTYPEWRGAFYPRGLARGRELEHLAERVNSLELNSTFYGPRQPKHYRSWAARTPDDFVLAVKGPKTVTHDKRLRDVGDDLTAFFASGVHELGAKLGPVLWQLPPWLPFKPERVTAFLDALPRDVRHAVEVRHPSFADPEFLGLLRERGVAVVLADSAGRFPVLDELTADFAYLRLHGAGELYVSAYGPAELDRWAGEVRELAEDRDVFVYFDNTLSGAAPYNAMALADRVGSASSPMPNRPR